MQGLSIKPSTKLQLSSLLVAVATVMLVLLAGVAHGGGRRLVVSSSEDEPCKKMTVYYHDILYNGNNTGNATAAAVTKARESPYLLALAANPTFVSGLVAWAVAQAAKALLTSVVERRWDLRMLFSSGGMPSSHTALCTALTASVALCHGVSDALFPVCLGFTLIVMYDATGVRRHAGMQAEVRL